MEVSLLIIYQEVIQRNLTFNYTIEKGDTTRDLDYNR